MSQQPAASTSQQNAAVGSQSTTVAGNKKRGLMINKPIVLKNHSFYKDAGDSRNNAIFSSQNRSQDRVGAEQRDLSSFID